MRAQYFFRDSDRGLLAWDVRRLVELSRDFPVEELRVSDIAEIDESHWYAHEGDSPTCRSLLNHMRLIEEADLSFPIIVDSNGRVMDGMHRVCKALVEGKDTIVAARFTSLPAPDYVGCDADDLPYDD
ncbi:MAG: hypothetical protein AAFN50_00735 [Pseudomonadota bacterium]